MTAAMVASASRASGRVEAAYVEKRVGVDIGVWEAERGRRAGVGGRAEDGCEGLSESNLGRRLGGGVVSSSMRSDGRFVGARGVVKTEGCWLSGDAEKTGDIGGDPTAARFGACKKIRSSVARRCLALVSWASYA